MTRKLFAYTLLPTLAFVLLGAGVASAHGSNGSFGRDGGMHRGGFGLMSADMRAEFKENFKGNFTSLSDEERTGLREERQRMMEERHQEFEDFSGLTHEEVREIRHSGESIGDAFLQNGVTEEDAEDFLIERAEDRVENIVERFDLDAGEEQTLRDRIANFVKNILAKWFQST